MSTYCSDFDLDVMDVQGTPGLVDVAHDCFGRDVRVIVDGRAVYVSPDSARLIASSLIERALLTEGAARRHGQ